jgi:hypothetical protein
MSETGITFICFADPNSTAKTFVAVRTADREATVRDMFPADCEMWIVDFPGLAPLAAQDLAADPNKHGSILGTAVEGEWTSWYPPVPAPAVPEAA